MGDFGFSGFGGLLGDIGDAILNYVIDFINEIVGFLNALVQWAEGALNYLFDVDVNIANFAFSASQIIYKLHQLIDVILAKLGTIVLFQRIYDLYLKLQAFFEKLKAWLDMLHQLQQKYVAPILRNAINLIQRIRKVLVVFRILHLGFAQRLDAWLSSIEGRIAQGMLLVAQKTNVIIGWMNWVIHPLGTIKRNIFVRSFLIALDELMVGLFGHSWAVVWGVNPNQGPPANKTATPTATVSTVILNVQNGTGDEGAILSRGPQMIAQLNAEWGFKATPSGF